MSNFNKSYLPDGETLFKVYWTQMGEARSINTLRRWCKSNGYINPETGKMPTQMAVWFRMYRWMANNKETAFEIFMSSPKNEDNHFSYEVGKYTRQNFEEWFRSQAKTCYYGRPRALKRIVS